jgi:Protein of unknown function (DUF3102)
MEALNDWRAALRRFFTERIGQELSVGELYDRVGSKMPLHHATRDWVTHGGEIGAASHDDMRWQTFSAEVRLFNLRFDPPISRMSPLRKTTKVTVLTVDCKGCGRSFISHRDVQYCGAKCRCHWRRREKSKEQKHAIPDPPADPPPPGGLSDLAVRIRAEHRAAGEALRHAITAGELLFEAKRKLRRGEWLPWLEANCEMSARMAQAYMRIARWNIKLEPANTRRVADSTIRGALKELCKARLASPESRGADETVVELRAPRPLLASREVTRHRYTLTLPEGEFLVAKATAAQRNMNISDLYRQALREWLRVEVPQAAE